MNPNLGRSLVLRLKACDGVWYIELGSPKSLLKIRETQGLILK